MACKIDHVMTMRFICFLVLKIYYINYYSQIKTMYLNIWSQYECYIHDFKVFLHHSMYFKKCRRIYNIYGEKYTIDVRLLFIRLYMYTAYNYRTVYVRFQRTGI